MGSGGLIPGPGELYLKFRFGQATGKGYPRGLWYGMVEVCEGAPVAVSGWVLADRHDVRPCAASSLLRETISVSNIIGGTGKLGIALN